MIDDLSSAELTSSLLDTWLCARRWLKSSGRITGGGTGRSGRAAIPKSSDSTHWARVELHRRLVLETGASLPVTAVFEYPTPAALAEHLVAVLRGTEPTGRRRRARVPRAKPPVPSRLRSWA